jgi:Asp-tRNA(Asn)/Glu-tRNA(Gln) amidotransferase A subunit family amidase
MARTDQLTELTGTEAARKIREGFISSSELVKACLTRIEETDGQLKAWAHLDPEAALARAGELDAIRQSGKPIGALHGVPVGLKDIVDTSGLPTECGTPIFENRKSESDAAIVDRLHEAGAVILGKTVTTEFAFLHPSQTHNPHNLERSPGGSSSGSAAAVAAFQVPLAVGTQTNGSTIRPASFCGTYGFKPTRGVISRRGILRTSGSLDQVGAFGRSLEDVALLVDSIGGYDPADPLSYARPRPGMVAGAGAEVPVEPAFAWFELPFADRLAEDCREGLMAVTESLGARVEVIPAPKIFARLVQSQKIIHEYEINQELGDVFADNSAQLSDDLRSVAERSRGIGEAQYQDALEDMAATNGYFEAFFRDYDAVISPSAAGEAVMFGEGTGDPIFSTIWTLAGLPCLTLPILVGEHGLPIGVQLIGAAEEDDRLLRTANWVQRELQTDSV